jgi:uncharacterized protein YdhG (YjbR/CyaY superfamily)
LAKRKPTTIDECLAGASAEHRAALAKLRRLIHKIEPRVEECISYQLPAFRFDGRLLVAFGAWKNHCALYPCSGKVLEAFKDELKGFETSKGTIQFTPRKPIPNTLVKKIVRARVAENAGKQRKPTTRAGKKK